MVTKCEAVQGLRTPLQSTAVHSHKLGGYTGSLHDSQFNTDYGSQYGFINPGVEPRHFVSVSRKENIWAVCE